MMMSVFLSARGLDKRARNRAVDRHADRQSGKQVGAGEQCSVDR